uniref:HSF-type DNA-binding domain-containing protein n=1 Tax=Grammatophora oceanica TaxID=210454 RepID=A0A7S1VXF6_9STRA|mmetsp:Transcript_9282/g.13582  ORF Transcript_9282/g.13582 Transcript_9282/m.13582 type:complete len:281 (+) Transcript_9282:124-966(+)|eukprot:CAMPEP_0194027882 /NCGR_PEP_ID=MMETSP0009_2-20130614/1928_1 /TAXON_ID=210454 /ORGANISM="Grammatophora oceanica, Strain CCMP 410" /LENGTH=280 /DNA_ID=CAMNT_0038667077 /DNA_START=111 /DNA_END=953 /DNA_ORIENTATION=+
MPARVSTNAQKTKKPLPLDDEGDDENAKIFPQRLMEILSEPSNYQAISWLPHGKAFIIVNRQKFANDVLPKYFRKTKYTSFTRKLNRWNFTRVTRGPELGAYYHEFFQRGDEALCTQMYCKNERAKFAVALKGEKASKAPENSQADQTQKPKTTRDSPSSEQKQLQQSPQLRPNEQLMQFNLLKAQVPTVDPATQTRMLLANPQLAFLAPQMQQNNQANLLLGLLQGSGASQQGSTSPPMLSQSQGQSKDAAMLRMQQLVALQQQNVARRSLNNYRAFAA